MSTTLKYGSFIASFAALAALSDLGCVCPPCPGAGAPTTPTAGGGQSAAMSSGPSASSASANVASGSRLIIWDGDGHSAGSKPQGWADCDKKPDCKSTVAATPGAGKDGSTGLKFSVSGPGWKGMGWNWFGWWPETAGTDIGPYGNIAFWIRLEAKTPDMAPELGAVTASLGCSKAKKNSGNGAMDKYGKELADGKWHKVVIPIADLQKGEGAEFDPGTAWEFRLSVWTPDPKAFTLYVDEIAAEKPEKP
jgi:hypothetical protein